MDKKKEIKEQDLERKKVVLLIDDMTVYLENPEYFPYKL